MKITNKEVIADEGKYICRKETEVYGKRMTLYPYKKETELDFEEITDEEYKLIQEAELKKLNLYVND